MSVWHFDEGLVFNEGYAVLSEDGTYRYRLNRRWREGGSTVLFVMLNPSTADHNVDDPTIRRCLGFAKAWGHAALEVVNLFALRATDPDELEKGCTAHARGPENVEHVMGAMHDAHTIVAAWGAWPTARRGVTPLDIVRRADGIGRTLFCLGKTKAGMPRHPLYVRADQPLQAFP